MRAFPRFICPVRHVTPDADDAVVVLPDSRPERHSRHPAADPLAGVWSPVICYIIPISIVAFGRGTYFLIHITRSSLLATGSLDLVFSTALVCLPLPRILIFAYM